MALAAWAVIPVADGWAIANINVGVLYLFAVSSLGVYGVIMAGWASNSKYPLLSALRVAAQMVSYEVSIGFVIVTVLLCAGSLNLTDIVHAQDTRFGLLGWYWLPLLPMFVIFFVSALAETNRPPFDLAEAESELVAGYMVEYSASLFLLQFLTELVAILTMSSMTTIFFLGGWLSPLPFAPFTWIPGVVWFLAKAWCVVFMFSFVKAFVPRYRYDQLMRLGWKVFLPISLFMVVLVAGVLEATGWGVVIIDVEPSRPRGAAHGAETRRSREVAVPRRVLRRVRPDRALHVQAEGDAQLSAREVAAVARASAASTRCAAIPTARSAASPASCARRSARRRRSPSRPGRAATTAPAARRATTST